MYQEKAINFYSGIIIRGIHFIVNELIRPPTGTGRSASSSFDTFDDPSKRSNRLVILMASEPVGHAGGNLFPIQFAPIDSVNLSDLLHQPRFRFLFGEESPDLHFPGLGDRDGQVGRSVLFPNHDGNTDVSGSDGSLQRFPEDKKLL